MVGGEEVGLYLKEMSSSVQVARNWRFRATWVERELLCYVLLR